MILNIPLAVWLGMLTIIFVFTTASFGIAVHVFHKNVFRYHRFFAFTTLILALIHATLALMLWFWGIVL